MRFHNASVLDRGGGGTDEEELFPAPGAIGRCRIDTAKAHVPQNALPPPPNRLSVAAIKRAKTFVSPIFRLGRSLWRGRGRVARARRVVVTRVVSRPYLSPPPTTNLFPSERIVKSLAGDYSCKRIERGQLGFRFSGCWPGAPIEKWSDYGGLTPFTKFLNSKISLSSNAKMSSLFYGIASTILHYNNALITMKKRKNIWGINQDFRPQHSLKSYNWDVTADRSIHTTTTIT